MEVGIRVVSENFTTGSIRHTNTSYFTMVALNPETKNPEPVAGLLLEGSEDIRRFLEGRLRKRLRKLHDNDLHEAREEIAHADGVAALKKENCKVALSINEK